MKFTIEFIRENVDLFVGIMSEEDKDYIAFRPVDDMWALAECWDDVHKSTMLVAADGSIATYN